jgi:hypothetical protein
VAKAGKSTRKIPATPLFDSRPRIPAKFPAMKGTPGFLPGLKNFLLTKKKF